MGGKPGQTFMRRNDGVPTGDLIRKIGGVAGDQKRGCVDHGESPDQFRA